MLLLIFLTWCKDRSPSTRGCDWQGSVLEWLRCSLFASESRCQRLRLGLQCRPGKPKSKNNTVAGTARSFFIFCAYAFTFFHFCLPVLSTFSRLYFIVSSSVPGAIFCLATTGWLLSESCSISQGELMETLCHARRLSQKPLENCWAWFICAARSQKLAANITYRLSQLDYSVVNENGGEMFLLRDIISAA